MKFISIKKFFFFTLFILLTTNIFAETIYLKANKYLDVKSGLYVTPANLLIADGKIIAINPKNIPTTATVINKPNLILLPGLMDMHVHLPNDINQSFALQFAQDDDAMATVRGVKNAKILLLAGFTTVRNLGLNAGESFVDVALSKASEANWITAPHIIPAGHPLSITGGHMDADMVGAFAPNVLSLSYRTGVADGVDEVIKSVRYQIKHGAKVIKAAATAGVLSQEEGVGNQQYSYEELKAMVDEANRHDVFVAVHAHGTEGINAAIKAGVRSIEHGSLLNEESIRLMKQHGTFLIPTAYLIDGTKSVVMSPLSQKKSEYLRPLAKKNLRMAIQAGVKIAFGTDSAVMPHGENAKEFTTLVNLGMKPIDAIRAATINATELLNFHDRGEIKMGYHADIIGVTENPLENIKALEHVGLVMKDGQVFKG